ncbi:MAG: hypothetical protein LC746_09405 [Acidobacteria bacterium]|nr:hypothetical protein [Acidobacteriota bacterium]
MIERTLAIALACSLLVSAAAPLASAQTTKQDAKRAARWRELLSSYGTGKDSVVAVRLRDKSELKGYLSEKDDESFVVTNAETGASARVLYAQVEKVEITSDVLKGALRRGTRPKTLAKNIAIGVGVLVVFGLILGLAGVDD